MSLAEEAVAEVATASPRHRGGSSQKAAPSRRARPASLTAVIALVARRGMLLLAMVTVAGVEAAVMLQRGAQWRGDLIWTIDWLAVGFIVVGPVVAAFAAVDTARLSLGAAHLSRNRVTRTPAFGLFAVYTVGVGAVHGCALLVGLVISAPPAWPPAMAAAIMVQLLIISLFAALGTLVGRFLTTVLAGIVAALVAFAAVYLLSVDYGPVAMLVTGMATIPRVGYDYNVTYLLAQVVMLVLAITAALVLRPLHGRSLRRVTGADAGVALGAVVLAAAVAWTGPPERLSESAATPTFCGAVQTVPTCFYPEHERVATAFQEQFAALVQASERFGYADLLPSRVEEASRTVLPTGEDVAPFFVMPEHLQGQAPTAWEIVLGFVQPVHCEQVQGEAPPSDRYWEDLSALTATWAGLVDPTAAETAGYFGEPLPPEAAVTLAEQFRTCTYPHF